MAHEKTSVEKINSILDLIAQTNQMLDRPFVQRDPVQNAQFRRLKDQFIGQLIELLETNRMPIEVTRKRTPRKPA